MSMSDKDFLLDDQPPVIRMRVWALGQMVWGAFLAGAVLLAIGVTLLAIYGVSLLLPEESKQAPSPYGAIEIVQTSRVV